MGNFARWLFCHRKTDMAVMVLCLAAIYATGVATP